MVYPKTVTTKEVQKYIDENWQKYLHREIAEHLNVREQIVSGYCIKMKYRKYKKKLDGNQA